jgi:putative endonuclease
MPQKFCSSRAKSRDVSRSPLTALDKNGAGLAFWAYILRCADGRYYTGHTENLELRLGQHQAGGYSEFTSRRRPVELMWSQYFPTRIEALEAERQIEPWSRAKKEALIRGDWAALSFYARPPKERPSTSLGTNGLEWPKSHPFVPSDLDECSVGPFVSSEAKRSRDTSLDLAKNKRPQE